MISFNAAMHCCISRDYFQTSATNLYSVSTHDPIKLDDELSVTIKYLISRVYEAASKTHFTSPYQFQLNYWLGTVGPEVRNWRGAESYIVGQISRQQLFEIQLVGPS